VAPAAGVAFARRQSLGDRPVAGRGDGAYSFEEMLRQAEEAEAQALASSGSGIGSGGVAPPGGIGGSGAGIAAGGDAQAMKLAAVRARKAAASAKPRAAAGAEGAAAAVAPPPVPAAGAGIGQAPAAGALPPLLGEDEAEGNAGEGSGNPPGSGKGSLPTTGRPTLRISDGGSGSGGGGTPAGVSAGAPPQPSSARGLPPLHSGRRSGDGPATARHSSGGGDGGVAGNGAVGSGVAAGGVSAGPLRRPGSRKSLGVGPQLLAAMAREATAGDAEASSPPAPGSRTGGGSTGSAAAAAAGGDIDAFADSLEAGLGGGGGGARQRSGSLDSVASDASTDSLASLASVSSLGGGGANGGLGSGLATPAVDPFRTTPLSVRLSHKEPAARRSGYLALLDALRGGGGEEGEDAATGSRGRAGSEGFRPADVDGAAAAGAASSEGDAAAQREAQREVRAAAATFLASPAALRDLATRAANEKHHQLSEVGVQLLSLLLERRDTAPAFTGAAGALFAPVATKGFASNKGALVTSAVNVCCGLITRDAAAAAGAAAPKPGRKPAASSGAAVGGAAGPADPSSPAACAASLKEALAELFGGCRGVKNKKHNAGCLRVLTKLVRARVCAWVACVLACVGEASVLAAWRRLKPLQPLWRCGMSVGRHLT
jgi:hypothetical protein